MTLRLDTQFDAVINYHGLTDLADAPELSAKTVFERVCEIRSNKLPDPKIIGNAGSFFKNPISSKEKYTEVKKGYPEIVAYPVSASLWKLAAAWLIDQAGFKGQQQGHVGVHHNQALVLVNHGQGDGAEIIALAKSIQTAVHDKFNVALEPEVNIIGSSGRISLDDI